MAGCSLLTKLLKAFGEFLSAGLVLGPLPRLYGAQASGCAPIVRLVERGGMQIEPETPKTIAKLIAIGNPADGQFAAQAMVERGGGKVSHEAMIASIRLLVETTGIFTDTAGGATVAGGVQFVREGKLGGDDKLVICVTGNGLKTLDVVEGVLLQSPIIVAKVREFVRVRQALQSELVV